MLLHVISEEGYFGKDKKHVKGEQMIVFNANKEEIIIKDDKNIKENLDVLLITNKLINEPIARYEPFVINAEEEIYESIKD